MVAGLSRARELRVSSDSAGSDLTAILGLKIASEFDEFRAGHDQSVLGHRPPRKAQSSYFDRRNELCPLQLTFLSIIAR